MPASPTVDALLRQGVNILQPESVHIDTNVDCRRIGHGVTIYPGCRVFGKGTSIGPSCILGEEGPVTVQDCRIAEHVVLKSGFFSGATILAGANVGADAHVRSPSLIEEQVFTGHAVGLKQTVLMPFVTLGSLVNFCDCLMAGGTSRKNHSEVGSSYVHFNFTPHQDKATGSLIGDVPRGVFLDQNPIFLGGQGGIVGPVRIEYGSVVAAGTICRRDILKPDHLLFGCPSGLREEPYNPNHRSDLQRVAINNLSYIGNLHALLRWYVHVRSIFLRGNPWNEACWDGAVSAIRAMIQERINRLGDAWSNAAANSSSLDKVKTASGDMDYKAVAERWQELATGLLPDAAIPEDETCRDALLSHLAGHAAQKGYLESIRSLPQPARHSGICWLQSVVDSVASIW